MGSYWLSSSSQPVFYFIINFDELFMNVIKPTILKFKRRLHLIYDLSNGVDFHLFNAVFGKKKDSFTHSERVDKIQGKIYLTSLWFCSDKVVYLPKLLKSYTQTHLLLKMIIVNQAVGINVVVVVCRQMDLVNVSTFCRLNNPEQRQILSFSCWPKDEEPKDNFLQKYRFNRKRICRLYRPQF